MKICIFVCVLPVPILCFHSSPFHNRIEASIHSLLKYIHPTQNEDVQDVPFSDFGFRVQPWERTHESLSNGLRIREYTSICMIVRL